jgi:hypothetical protein
MSDTKTEKCQFCGSELWAYVNDMAVFKCGNEMGMRSKGCLENEIANLTRDLTAARERIKRLEKAGDALEHASVVSEAGEDPNGFEKLLIAQRAWTAAKEAKP